MIFVLKITDSFAQSDPFEVFNRKSKICTVKETQKTCLLNYFTNHIFSYIGQPETHFVYFLRINEYEKDSIISMHLERMCNRSSFRPDRYNGFVQRNESFFLIVKTSISDIFIEDFKIDTINEDIINLARNKLFDNSAPLSYCLDELGGACLWSFEYNFKEKTFKESKREK